MGISLQNDYSFLFGTSSNTTTGNTFSLSDYAMIKNGTYKKLMKAYYADTDNSFVKSVAGSKAASQDNTVEIKKLQETSKALSESAEALYGEKGKDLYTEDKRDDLLKAVSGFVKDYNSAVDAINSSDNDKVVRNHRYFCNINYTDILCFSILQRANRDGGHFFTICHISPSFYYLLLIQDLTVTIIR